MNIAYRSQHFQDWASQQWNIWRGRRIGPEDMSWLMGPFGKVGAQADDFITTIAVDEELEVERDLKTGGLLSSINDLELSKPEYERLRPEIIDFYENTSLYELDLKIEWGSYFPIFGRLVSFLYSNRLNQLNFPMNRQEVSDGINSEVVALRDPNTRNIKYTAWYRTFISSGRVLYSGIYSTCKLPSGKSCIKAVFPLPRGNATVILEPTVGINGGLCLASSGKQYGDPGFYFLVNDSKGCHWAQYIPSFREYLDVFVDKRGKLRAEHTITLWKQRVFKIFFKMSRPANSLS
jgi:hypothetical protein